MLFHESIRILATTCGCVAICATVLRLYYRWSRQHLGLDDAWAAFSLLFVFFLIAGAWLRSADDATDEHRITGYYMLETSFTCVIWSARMSILFSIMRIIPYLMTLRRYAYASMVLFLAMWLVMLVQKTYVCQHDSAWKHKQGAQCVLGKSVGAVELSTDITADCILVALPIRLLWDISISESRRKLLITIFSASMITSIVSIIHASFELGPDRDGEGIAAHIEADTSLVICNLAVLVTWAVRAFRHGEDIESGESFTGGGFVFSKQRNTGRSTRLATLRFTQDPPIVLTAMEDTSGKDGEIGELSSQPGSGSVLGSGKQERLPTVSPTLADSTVTSSVSSEKKGRDLGANMRNDGRSSLGSEPQGLLDLS
ncbi:hypothetical protein WOLCODRAFT_139288 [Wolfiporia cocos MD-104 SS10]|uniref:Rhodopsin domain-containing protein n=1 Tax=Wolfiporia cocos (strain MD-104) TaxID=742152 RepID=A0A2H3JTG6_WOLCO|nr:hypothetical protein WOLCODRAFT_139288 [Wolfiporia cocos MD-104 SS10]